MKATKKIRRLPKHIYINTDRIASKMLDQLLFIKPKKRVLH